MTIDPVAFIHEFGLSVVIIVFVGWFIYSIAKSFVPHLAEALAKRIEAGTRLVEVTTPHVALPSLFWSTCSSLTKFVA